MEEEQRTRQQQQRQQQQRALLMSALRSSKDETVRHAFKLVTKIVENPSDSKYRRLKTSSALFRERFNSARPLLGALGFYENQGDRLVVDEIHPDALDLIKQRLELGATSFGAEERGDDGETDDEDLARAIAMSTQPDDDQPAEDNKTAPVATAKDESWSEEDRKRFVQRRLGELFQEATSRGVAPNEAAARALATAQRELEEKLLVQEEPPQREDKRFKRMEAPEKVADVDMETIEVLYKEEGMIFVDPSFPPIPSSIFGDEDPSTWRCAGCGGLNPISPEMNSRQGVLRILEDARQNRGSGTLSCRHCGRAQPALEVSLRPSGWLRPNDIRDDLTMQTSAVPWVVFRGDPRPDDVRQGGLGNCWMVCALSVLAEVAPQLLRRCFELSPTYAPSGAYRVRLNSAGTWHTLTIDDSFPVTALDTAAYLKPARRSLWAPLLEKAAAKLHGSYAALQGGSFAEAFGMLTGFPVRRVVLDKFCVEFAGAAQRVYGAGAAGAAAGNDDGNDALAKNGTAESKKATSSSFEDQEAATLELFALLYSYKEAKFAVGASTFVKADDATWDAEMRSLGLQTRHAYGVLDARQYQDELLVKLRNPNGVALWTGDFSRSKCSRETIEALGLNDEDKGVFWMRCSDLAKYFVELTVCRLVPESYLEVRASGWLASRFGPGNAARLDVYSRTSVEIAIYQEAHAERGERAAGTAVDLGLAVLKMDESTGAAELVASSRRVAHTAGAACDATLEQDATPTSYLVVPLCFGHVGSTEPRKFGCAVHSSTHALALETIPLDPNLLAQAVVALAVKFGERQVLFGDKRSNRDFLAFYVLQDEAGLCVVAENLATFPLVAQLDAQTVRGFVSTRSENSTQDVLPPRSRMILSVLSRLPGYTQPKLEGLSYSGQMLPEDFVSHADTDHFPSLDHLDQLKPFHLPIPLPPATEEEQLGAAHYSPDLGGPGSSSSSSGAQIDAATLAGALRRAMGGGGCGGF